MTDKEIREALECCGNWQSAESCEDCPANTYGFGCAQKMAKHSLDLINRQKAEIEGLKISVEALSQKAATARDETVDEYAKRLTRSISGCFHCADMQIIRAKMKDVAEQMKNNN